MAPDQDPTVISARKVTSLPGQPNAQLATFAHEDCHGLTIDNAELRRCVFSNVDARESTITGGRIRRTIFRDCYLHSVKFDGVDLMGSEFWNCNLRYATFDRCKMWFVTFHGCDLDYDHLISCLPPEKSEPNMRVRILRSLRENATGRGESAIADHLLLFELSAERRHLLNLVLIAGDYYKKFTPGQRISALVSLVLHYLQLGIWGYGLRVKNLMISALVLVLIFALCLSSCEAEYRLPNNDVGSVGFIEAVYIAMASFSTVGAGDFLPNGPFPRFIAVLASVCGTLFLGALAATIYRRIRR